MINILNLDHLVLTVKDIEETVKFYEKLKQIKKARRKSSSLFIFLKQNLIKMILNMHCQIHFEYLRYMEQVPYVLLFWLLFLPSLENF